MYNFEFTPVQTKFEFTPSNTVFDVVLPVSSIYQNFLFSGMQDVIFQSLASWHMPVYDNILHKRININIASIIQAYYDTFQELDPVFSAWLLANPTSGENTWDQDLSWYAELDEGWKIPANILPSYVDDIIEVSTYEDLPTIGETGKIYVVLSWVKANRQYRWWGTLYAEISESLALWETSATAYRGDRWKTAFDHSQTPGNPHWTTKTDLWLGEVENTSDLNKPISTAMQTALTKIEDDIFINVLLFS